MGTNARARAWAKSTLLTAAAGSALCIATSAGAQTAAATGANSTDHSTQIEEVVVTASRRETSIRQTPTAISAYGGQQLEKEHVQTFSDLTTMSPNVQLGSNGANTDIAIRGIGSNLQLAGSDPGVAFYVDGIYVAEPALALQNFLDVSRVEVLRGPQGTLFGRNATGGAVNIISNTPTADPTYGFNASAGSPAGEHVDVFASGPLNSNGTLLGRVAVEQTYQEGFEQNVAPTGPRSLDDKNDYAGRIQLEWRPTDNFSARLLADYQKSDTAGSAYYLVGTPNAALGLPAALSGTYIARPSDDNIAVNQAASNVLEKSVALFLNWKIGGGSLRATVSKQNTDLYRSYDGDGTAVDFTSTTIKQSQDSTYAELLYSSDDKQRFSYIVGANYFNSGEIQNVNVPVIGFPAPVLIYGDVKTESIAVFGHAQYKLTDVWKIFGGVRYSTDHKREAESNNFIGSLTQNNRWSKPTFEIGTSYDINKSVTGYVKYATGYKSGGYSAGSLGPPFAPETNAMWEVGLKGSYFDGNLQANIALFDMSYQNLQVNQVVGVTSVVTNAARARIDGAELELVQKITPELRLQFDGGWLNARFDSFLTEDSARPALGVLNLAGNTLPQAPKFTLGIGPVYNHTFGNGGALTLAARYDWKSRVYFSEFNLPLISQAASGRLSAYANYDLPGGHWQLGVYGRNLTNEHTFNSMDVSSAVLNSVALATIEPLREFGFELHYRY